MTNTISIDEWLGVMDREYLSAFIKDGGAAVKFAVSAEKRTPALREALKRRCEALDYVFVTLDAVTSRVHMPQDVFFGLASQVDWRLAARRVILRLLTERDYRVDGIDPDSAGNVIDAVARANGLEAPSVLAELRPILQNEVAKNANMARAFRVAMTHLCLFERETGEPEQYVGQPLLDWITGTNMRISNVRPFQIHTAINRITARHFIESALYWVRCAGYAGTVIVLDNARVTLARNPRDGRRFYTRAMAMDHYELLREFIDGVDRLSGALLEVAPGYDFIDDQSARGWSLYPALQTRVMDDVRDKELVNPAAALIRLS